MDDTTFQFWKREGATGFPDIWRDAWDRYRTLNYADLVALEEKLEERIHEEGSFDNLILDIWLSAAVQLQRYIEEKGADDIPPASKFVHAEDDRGRIRHRRDQFGVHAERLDWLANRYMNNRTWEGQQAMFERLATHLAAQEGRELDIDEEQKEADSLQASMRRKFSTLDSINWPGGRDSGSDQRWKNFLAEWHRWMQ